MIFMAYERKIDPFWTIHRDGKGLLCAIYENDETSAAWYIYSEERRLIVEGDSHLALVNYFLKSIPLSILQILLDDKEGKEI